MARRTLFFAILLLIARAPSAQGQHVQDPSKINPDIKSCSLCHAAHVSAQAPYLLKIDDVSDAAAQAPGLGPVSESCLRCHWTSALRDQQPEFIVPADPLGGYLGPGLGDDHPLGNQGGAPSSAMLRAGASPALLPQRSSTVAPEYAAAASGPVPGAPIQCTACHEPHAPGPNIIPDLTEQFVICTVCHPAYMPYPEEHSMLACTECHQMHGANSRLLRDPASNPTCTQCHATPPVWP